MRLIDLDELLKFPIRLDHYDKENGDEHFAYGVEAVLEYAENLPVVDAVPVHHAHWVFRDEDKHLLEDGCIPCNMWCSYCGQWSDNDRYGDAYCHNCGSRMNEPDLADEIAKEVSEDAGTD